MVNKFNIPYEIFYGVNGSNITISNTDHDHIKLLSHSDTMKTYYYDNTIRVNKQIMKKGELGCAWSHHDIYNMLINDNTYDNYLVLEDDAEFVSNIMHLHSVLNKIPEDYDVCHIGMSDWYPFILKDKINDYFYTCEKHFFNRTTSYIVSKKGAHLLLNKYMGQIVLPADDLLSTTFLNDNNFKFYVPEKYLFHEPTNTISTIKSVNSKNL